MKRNQRNIMIIFALAISLIFPNFGVSVYAHADNSSSHDEVVFQADFEDGAQDWYGRWGPTVESVNETAHGGTHSLKTTGRDAGWKGPARGITPILERGKSYHFTSWVKAIGSDSSKVSMTLLRQYNNGQQDYHSLAYEAAVNTGGWTKLEGDFTFSSELAADTFDLYFESSNPTLAFYIDDISIVKKSNPYPSEWGTSFEDGTVQGWQPRIGPEILTVVSGQTHNNSAYALKVTGRTDSYFGPSLDVTSKLQAGSTYTFTAWLRLVDGTPATNIQMTMQKKINGVDSYDTFSFEKVNSSSWIQIKGSYQIRSEVEQYSLYFESPNKTLAFYLDDFLITKNPDLGPIILEDNIGSLKDEFKDDFLIGTAFSGNELEGVDGEMIKKHFSSITPGNIMKMDFIQPREGEFHWTEPDKAFEFAANNGIRLRGHTLVWHQQTPDWVFIDGNGAAMNPSESDPGKKAANKALVLQRMKTHIETVLGRYKGKVYAWDVVNEVIDPSQANGMRKSLWYEIAGEDFIEKAFEYAHAADPAAKLYINEYQTEVPQKREFLKQLVQRLLAKGIPVDGVGHQMHINLPQTSVQQIELALKTFADLGLDNQVTELDMDIYSTDSQRMDTFPEELAIKQAYKYKAIFNVFRAYKDHLSSVTFWGKSDGNSWLRSFPVIRNNWPLLFDERLQAKYAYWGLVDPSRLPPLIQDITAAKGTPSIDGNTELLWDVVDWTLLSSGDFAAKFKTLWDENNVYLYADVADSVFDGNDSVEVFLDKNNGKTTSYQADDVHITLSRGGNQQGLSYRVKNSSGGYQLEAAIPIQSIGALDGFVGFDIRIKDAHSPERVLSWNDVNNAQDSDTSRWGKLIFGAEHKLSSAIKGTPVIDAVEDSIWNQAKPFSTDVWVEGLNGAKANVKTMWDDGHLYVWAKVADPLLSKLSNSVFMQDSVEIFVSQKNGRTNFFSDSDGQYRINFDNEASFSSGIPASNLVSATKIVPGGYIVEAAIKMDKVEMTPGTIIGFDFQVNDDGQGDGNRSSIAIWSDNSGTSYKDTTRYGYLQLTRAPSAFYNKVVYGATGAGLAEIAASPSEYSQDSNFSANFNSYFNQQFNAQPLPLAIVTPDSVANGNRSISQNSSNVAVAKVLNAGAVSIANAYGAMTIGDAGTVGSTVIYSGDSCNIGPTSNLVINGDIVCKGPLVFNGNIDGLTIHGKVIAAGGITFKSSVGAFTIDQTLSSQGSISFQGSNIAAGLIKGDMIGRGISFNGFNSLSVLGNVSSTEDFMPSSGNYASFIIGKSLFVTGNSQFSTLSKVAIQGSFYGKGNINMQGQISGNGLTVGNAMLGNGSVDFHGISGKLSIGSFLGARNQLNFHSNISTNVQLGGLAAGQITITNNYAPAQIFINYNPPNDSGLIN